MVRQENSHLIFHQEKNNKQQNLIKLVSGYSRAYHLQQLFPNQLDASIVIFFNAEMSDN